MKKLFTNDTVFKFAAIIGFICSILYAITCFAFWQGILATSYATVATFMLLNGVATLALYISYKKHSKNVMKGLIGALLYGDFAAVLSITFPFENTFTTDIVCTFVFLGLNFAILINHFIINSDHKSRKVNILINQWLCVLLVVVAFIWSVSWIPYLDGVSIAFQFSTSLGITCIVATIVSVESRLDAYRIDREAAGWTEEAGYPEGYVHQKDRDKK